MKIYSLHSLPLQPASGPVFLDGALADFEAARASRALDSQLALLAYAGECRFDGLVLQERHAERGSGLVSAALLAAAVVRQTPRLRLLLHDLPLAMKDPHLWAEELAWLDLVSGGRIEATFAVGDGPAWWCTPGWPAHAREKFSESLSLLARAQTEPPPLRHEGLHHSYKFFAPTLLPLQAGMPLGLAGHDGFTQAEAIRVQWPCLALDAPRATQTAVAEAQRAAGHPSWLGAFVYVGPAREAQAATDSLAALHEAESRVPPQWLAPPGLVDTEEYAALLSPARPSPRPAFVGSADEVARGLQAWQEEAGASHLALCFQWPGWADASARAAMSRFAADAMPRLRP